MFINPPVSNYNIFSSFKQEKKLTYHELFRHSAFNLLMNELLKKDAKLDINKTLFTLSNRFGHTQEVMIKTYTHLYQDNIQDEIVDILDNL